MPGVSITPRDDGKTQFVFSQSWLNTMLGTCQEQARLELVNELELGPTDATAIGTAVHAGIEYVLLGGRYEIEAMEAAREAWDAEVAHPNFRWVQVRDDAEAMALVADCLTAWHQQVFPQLGTPLGVELPYRLFLCDGEGWVAYLEGAIDFIDERSVWDWKTAGDDRKYRSGRGGEAWKLKRWSIQASSYTLAAYEACFFDDVPVPFTYAAMTKGKGEAQLLELQRGPADWEWLRQQVRAVVPMMLADLPSWPLNDQHALCSPKWCRAWEQCKGATLGANPW